MNMQYKNRDANEIRINKLLLRKALGNRTEKSIQNQANALIEKGFLKAYRKVGGADGEFIFTVKEQPYLNPYVLLCEVEYFLLTQFRPRDRKKVDMMLKELKRLSREIEKVFIERLSNTKPDDQKEVLADYFSMIRQQLESKGITLIEKNPQKSIQSAQHESYPYRQNNGHYNSKLKETEHENKGMSKEKFLEILKQYNHNGGK